MYKRLVKSLGHMIDDGMGVEDVVVRGFTSITPSVVLSEIEYKIPSADGSGCIAFAMSCVSIASRVHSERVERAPLRAHAQGTMPVFASLVEEVNSAMDAVDDEAHIMTGQLRPFAAFAVYCRAMAATSGRTEIVWDAGCPAIERATRWLARVFDVYIGFESTLSIWNRYSAEMRLAPVDAMMTTNTDAVMEGHTEWERLTGISLTGRVEGVVDMDLDSLTLALLHKATASDSIWSRAIFTVRDQIRPSDCMPVLIHMLDHWVVQSTRSFTRVPSLLHALALWCMKIEGRSDRDISMKYESTVETGSLVCEIRDGSPV